MKISQTFSGVFLVVFAACAGFALIYLPNWIISNYETVSSLGSIWGTLYLIVIGFGITLLLGSAVWTIWKLWGASLLKTRRRKRRNKNPSELSIGQREREIDENLEQIEKTEIGGRGRTGFSRPA